MTTIDDPRLHGLGGHGGHGGGHDHHASYLEPKGGFWATVWDWASTIDHKKIGVMYLVAVMFMFFLGGMAALALRLELLFPTVPAVGHTGVTGSLFGSLIGNTESEVAG